MVLIFNPVWTHILPSLQRRLKMNILAIGDYPHDLEYGCAGTLIRHVQNGDDVFLMVITEGGKGGANDCANRSSWMQPGLSVPKMCF